MVKSRSYSPFRFAPWCFRDLVRLVDALEPGLRGLAVDARVLRLVRVALARLDPVLLLHLDGS